MWDSDYTGGMDIGSILNGNANKYSSGLNFDNNSPIINCNGCDSLEPGQQGNISFINWLQNFINELKDYFNIGSANSNTASSSDTCNCGCNGDDSGSCDSTDNSGGSSDPESCTGNITDDTSSTSCSSNWPYTDSLTDTSTTGSVTNNLNSWPYIDGLTGTSSTGSTTDGFESLPFFVNVGDTSDTESSTDNSSYWPYTGNEYDTYSTGSSTGNLDSYPYSGYTTDNSVSNSSSGSSGNPGILQTKIDFEDGQFPGTLPQAQEPVKIMTDSNGNKFLRFTANYGDHEGIPDGEYPDRVRDTMYMAGDHWSMPELNNSNNHMSYSADIRFIDDKAKRGYSANSFFELFQGSDKYKSSPYGASSSSSGPPVRLIRNDNGHVCFETVQDQGAGKEPLAKQYDLGYFAPGAFHNFKVDAVWSNNSSEGGYKVSVDGKEVLELKGNTYYNPSKSNLVPALKCGLYGTNAVGTVDVDNVEINNLSE